MIRDGLLALCAVAAINDLMYRFCRYSVPFRTLITCQTKWICLAKCILNSKIEKKITRYFSGFFMRTNQIESMKILRNNSHDHDSRKYFMWCIQTSTKCHTTHNTHRWTGKMLFFFFFPLFCLCCVCYTHSVYETHSMYDNDWMPQNWHSFWFLFYNKKKKL